MLMSEQLLSEQLLSEQLLSQQLLSEQFLSDHPWPDLMPVSIAKQRQALLQQLQKPTDYVCVPVTHATACLRGVASGSAAVGMLLHVACALRTMQASGANYISNVFFIHSFII